MRVDGKAAFAELPLRLAAMKGAPVIVADDGADSAMPQELRTWLVRIRLLEGVPFANLVADTELLPAESIRWFYLDRRWTDALVQGALSVGTVNSDDRVHLGAQYEAIRDELDAEERNYRRAENSPRFGGRVEAVSGFILRSQAVSGWPAIHVRAFNVDPAESDDATYPDNDPRRIRLLRLERLAPAVLFCMFDGIPQVVHVEEPRQGVQFGFDVERSGATTTAVLHPRDVDTFATLPGKPITVPFRDTPGATGVVDIQQLERLLSAKPATHIGAELDSAEYALQLIRFPYRQVFGEAEGPPLVDVFHPGVMYAEYVTSYFRTQS
jgi:hypothetical protein